MSVTGAHSERNRCSTQTKYSIFTQNVCSDIISIEVNRDERHTIDLLSIPIYQQMARVIYVDRCMVKWAGMLLSEHNEQMKDQEGHSDGTR